VRAAAVDAGIDHSTAYARRRAHPEFAEAWDAALRLRSGRAEEEELRAIEAVTTHALSRSPSASRPLPPAGEGLI
jgi:hypothetical protein